MHLKSISIAVLFCSGICFALYGLYSFHYNRTDSSSYDYSSHEEAENKEATKRARAAYFQRMLRDPATGTIPPNVRSRELNYSRKLPRRNDAGRAFFKFGQMQKSQSQSQLQFTWSEAGPFDIGGRTRALAVDLNNPDIIIAGGVSGGIWKSTDRGRSWELKSEDNQHLSVTWVVQDPRAGFRDTWYYASGEFRGGSARDRGGRANYYGQGIYKSTDNGESWQLLSATLNLDDTSFDNPFDYVLKLEVHPQTGSLFVATIGHGVLKSDDGGQSFQQLLGGYRQHFYSDLSIADDGSQIIGTLSGQLVEDRPLSNEPGIYRSTDNGQSWQNITFPGFPTKDSASNPDGEYRTVTDFAPSDPNLIYFYTFAGDRQDGSEDIRLFRYRTDTRQVEDLTDNLPDFRGWGQLNTQFNYNMVIAVKPDDPDFVLLGGTNLHRSTTGFTTPANDPVANWIGGYSPAEDQFKYPNQHPDQHVIFFEPGNPNAVWSGHDGGVSYTSDIRQQEQTWIDKNNGYVTTQFYSIALYPFPNDSRVIGGMQDRGTPYFRLSNRNESVDISSGDGGHAFLGQNYPFISTQNGRVVRLGYVLNGAPSYRSWAVVQPANASGQLFIHPYAVDPNLEDVMYYPVGNRIWRNRQISKLENQDNGGTSRYWESNLPVEASSTHIVSAIVATENPRHRVYFGASSDSEPPELYRWDQAHYRSDGEVDISIPDAANGAYLHAIAVNPLDGDELVAVFSNYNITGIYHSKDAGASWQAIEGNLTGNDNTRDAGPSIRNAAIVPTEAGTVYVVTTSAGIFSTALLQADATEWVHEAVETAGFAVSEAVDYRESDGTLVVGTHGRVAFRGLLISNPDADGVREQPEQFNLGANYPNPFNPTTVITFEVPETSFVLLAIYDINGREVMRIKDFEAYFAGRHSTTLSADNLASGVYFYQMLAISEESREVVFNEMRKMTVIK